jgi:tetratricopeptide (TPR) repeat protein
MMKVIVLLIVIAVTLFGCTATSAQDRRTQLGGNTGAHTLFGDFNVDESRAGSTKPILYEIVLYNVGGTPVARQFVSSKGRYQFRDLANGQYELAVLLEGEEIGRTRVEIMSLFKNDFRQDLSLEWRPPANVSAKPKSVSVADFYKRTASNEKLFNKAKEFTDQKRYDDSILSLNELLTVDPKDFQAWSELGTAYLLKQNYEESEKAYLRSIAERPTFFLGYMNLGRLRSLRKNFDGAIDPLTEAVKANPTSADANYLLGEAYLQLKKGSKAVAYLNEAARLGRADAHLRLATLYNAAGMKDRAAAEYEQFLKKRPDHEDRKKLEKYIADNKKP